MDDVLIPWPAEGPFLNQVFVARQLCAKVLDATFDGLSAPEGSRIVLYNETDAGLGDVAFATKLSWLIAAHLPAVDLLLVTSDPSKQSNFALPKSVRVISEAAYRDLGPSADKAPSLLLSAPGIFDHCRLPALTRERLKVSAEVPFQYVAEYGSLRQLKDDAFKGMMPALEALQEAFMDAVAHAHALAPEDMGHSPKSGVVVGVVGDEVTPLDNLLSAYRQVAPDNPMADWLRSPLLRARSCGLATGELGIHVEGGVPLMRPEPEALATLEDATVATLLLDGKRPEAYAREVSLYVGYAYEGIARFCDYIAALEAEQARPIDMIVPHRDSVTHLMETLFDEAAIARLRARGLGRIVLIGRDEAGESARVERALGPGKTLRLITRYPIGHGDLRRLHRAAHPATMVSGDQSFSEAVSMGKALLYLEPVYCQTFHLDAVLELADRVAPRVREILNFGMQYHFDPAGYPAIEARLKQPDLWDEYAAFNRTIQEEHDCSRRLINLINRALWTHHDAAVSKASSAALERAWQHADVARGVTLSGADLSLLRQSASEGP